MTNGINKRIAIGAGWTIAIRWADRAVSLLSIAILARLLLPADFGFVGYAMVVLAILDQFFQFSFETILIRDEDETKSKYHTVWTLEILKGLILALLIVFGAKYIAGFFREPDLDVILYCLATIPLLSGLKNIGTVDFQKELNFQRDFILNVSVRLAGSILTVVLALLLRSYWALVFGNILRTVLLVILSYVMCSFRPRLSLSEYSSVLGFSSWLLVQNIFSSMNARLPVIAIGRFFDAQSLAFFNMGRELTSMASAEIAAPIRRALYPGIAKMRGDRSQIASTMTAALGIIALVALPTVAGVGVTAPLLIPAFLGDNWVGAVPVAQVLSLHGALFVFYPSSHVVYYAMDMPKITARISILRLFLLVPTVLFAVPEYGVLGAAWVLLAVNAFVMILEYFILLRMTDMTLVGVVSAVWRSTLAVAVMALVVGLVLQNPPTPAIMESTIRHLTLCIVTGVLTYVLVVSTLWWASGSPKGAEAHVFRILKNIYNRSAAKWMQRTRANR
jgi:O-antigen/teichoic acid export membrane protein